MRNIVKEKLARGEQVIGTFFEMGGETAVEALGVSGIDYIVIDTEHGPFDVESAKKFVTVAERHDLTPFVRVKDVTRSSILKMLDIGAQGLIIPCVNTVDEVRDIIAYGKYAPLGQRGFFMARAAAYGEAPFAATVDGYFEHMNAETMLIPQCETKGCLEHIEDITAMDGVDGIFIGPYDLSIAIGKPAAFDDPTFLAALERVLAACQAAGKPCFIYTGAPAAAKAYLAQGFSGVAVNFDVALFVRAVKSMLQEIKG